MELALATGARRIPPAAYMGGCAPGSCGGPDGLDNPGGGWTIGLAGGGAALAIAAIGGRRINGIRGVIRMGRAWAMRANPPRANMAG